MAPIALTNAQLHLAGLDLTGYSNKIGLMPEVEDLDVTVFGAGGYRSRIGGLKAVEAEITGFFEAGTGAPDPALFTGLGVADQAFTAAATATEGGAAYLCQLAEFGYTPFDAEVGQAVPFELTAQGSSDVGLVRGQLAKAKGAVSATGQLGSVLNLGAPAAGQYVYCVVHVFTAGTTVTLQLQSDDGAGFASPTTRATIGPLTAVGGTWMTRIAGAISGETHWRLNVSAITGTFTVAAAIAVQ